MWSSQSLRMSSLKVCRLIGGESAAAAGARVSSAIEAISSTPRVVLQVMASPSVCLERQAHFAVPLPLSSQRLQVFDQVALLVRRQPQLAMSVVVVDDGLVRGEAAVVVEAALLPREEAGER